MKKSTKKLIKANMRLIFIIIIILVIAILTEFPAVFSIFGLPHAPVSNWVSFIFNNSNSRYQANSSITSYNIGQLKQRWMIPTAWAISSTPIVLNGTVYFADNGGNVYSVNISSGSLNWKVDLGSEISSTLTIVNGIIYVGLGPNEHTEVFALSQADGHTIWNTTLNSGEKAIWASPTIYNGMIYIGTAGAVFTEHKATTDERGEMFALNSTTGKLVWNFTTMVGTSGGAAVWSSAVVDPNLDSIYFGTGNAYTNTNNVSYAYSIISLNATSGHMNWVYEAYNSVVVGVDYDFGSTPNLFSVAIGPEVYRAVGLGSKDGNYYILNRINGKLLEKLLVGTPGSNGGITGLAGFIYHNESNPEIFIPAYYNVSNSLQCCGIVDAVSPSSGSIMWKFPTPGNIRGSVTIIPGAVLFGDLDGNMYAVSSTSGKELFSTTFQNRSIEAGITVADGFVLVPTAFRNYQMYYNSKSMSGLYAFSPT